MIIVGNAYSGLNSGGGGSMVTTANGISGNGSSGSPVALGGAMITDTLIDTSNFGLAFGYTDGDVSGQLSVGTGDLNFQVNNNALSATAVLQLEDTGHPLLFLGYTDNVGEKKIAFGSIDEGISGIVVTDTIEGVGLNGEDIFEIIGEKQYLQSANAVSVWGHGKFTGSNLTGNTLLRTYTSPSDLGSSAAFYLVTVAMFGSFSGGSCHIEINYNDPNGNAHTYNFPVLSADGDANYIPVTICVDGGATFSVGFVTDSPGFVVSVAGAIEAIGGIV